MHRTAAARNSRLLTQRQIQSTATPSVCPFCLQRSLHTTYRRHADSQEEENITPAERRRRQPVSATQMTLLARDKLIDRIRGKLWKGAPPGPDDPYTGLSRPTAPSEEPIDPAEDVVTIGGESSETHEDVRDYNRRTALEERERFQQAVDEAPTHSEYAPALRWEGLEVVGGESEWGIGAGEVASKTFRGFLPKGKVMSPVLLGLALQRAAVEVWFASSMGGNVMKLSKVGPEALNILDGVAHQVQLRKSGEGVELEFQDEGVREALGSQVEPDRASLDVVDEAEVTEEAEEVAAAGDEELVEEAIMKTLHPARVLRALGEDWKDSPVTNPTIKLAISRRLTQLTGHTFPSHVLNSATTLSHLLSYLKSSVQKPTTTYEALVGTKYAYHNPEKTIKPNMLDNGRVVTDDIVGPLPGERYGSFAAFKGLSNVHISGRRRTPIDVEKEKGRWKVIERTLREKGLPVTGMGASGGLQRIRPAHRP